MKKAVLLLMLCLVVKPAYAGIPMGDVLSLAQRVFVWTKKADQWLNYLSSFSSASDHMGAIREINRMFNLGFQDGLNSIAQLRIDLNRIKLYYEQIADWKGDPWREVFIGDLALKIKFPQILDYSLLKANPLSNNQDIKAYLDKFTSLQEARLDRIEQVLGLIRLLNEVEKTALLKIEELQESLELAARAQDSKDKAAATSKMLYNLSVVRLTALRTRLIGAMTLRALNEIRLKRQADFLEWSVFVDKGRAGEAKNYQLIKE